jgi:hypothetical protein
MPETENLVFARVAPRRACHRVSAIKEMAVAAWREHVAELLA